MPSGTADATRWRQSPGLEPDRCGCSWFPGPGRDTGALVQAASRGRVLVVAGAPSRAELPAGCGAVVHRVEAAHVYDGGGGPVAFVPDLVGPWWSDRLSRALAPLRCSRPEDGRSDAVPAHPRRRARRRRGHSVPGGRRLACQDCRRGPAPLARPTPAAVVGSGPRRAVRDRPLPRRPTRARRRDDGFGQVGVPPHAGHFTRDLVPARGAHLRPRRLQGRGRIRSVRRPSPRGRPRHRPRRPPGLARPGLVARRAATPGAAPRRGRRERPRGLPAGRAPDSEPVPRLVVVVDELRALVEELPTS